MGVATGMANYRMGMEKPNGRRHGYRYGSRSGYGYSYKMGIQERTMDSLQSLHLHSFVLNLVFLSFFSSIVPA